LIKFFHRVKGMVTQKPFYSRFEILLNIHQSFYWLKQMIKNFYTGWIYCYNYFLLICVIREAQKYFINHVDISCQVSMLTMKGLEINFLKRHESDSRTPVSEFLPLFLFLLLKTIIIRIFLLFSFSTFICTCIMNSTEWIYSKLHF
jgi:hypothetical protein